MDYIVRTKILCKKLNFKPIQDGPFRGCTRMEGPKKTSLPKICHAYPTIMKLGTGIPYLKKIQKYNISIRLQGASRVTVLLDQLHISIKYKLSEFNKAISLN